VFREQRELTLPGLRSACYARALRREIAVPAAQSRLARVARVVRRAGRRALDKIPPTPLGLVGGGLAALAFFYYGLKRLDLVLLVCGVVGLGLWALMLALTSGTAAIVWLRLRPQRAVEPLRAEAGYPRRTGFTAPALRFVPLMRCGWSWDEPAEATVGATVAGGRQVESVTPTERFQTDLVVRRVVIEDVLGLMRIAWRHPERAPVTVLPNVGQLRQMPVIRTLAGGEDLPLPSGDPEGDRVDYRRYGPGDPVRTILWKTFARTRQLMVRTPERAIAPARRTVAYLVAAPGDEPAAAAARVAVEAGILGGNWSFGADGSPSEGTRDVATALDWIAASAGARDQQAQGLEPFLREAERHGRVRGIVFVPAAPGPWLQRVIEAGARRRRLMDVIVATDGVDRAARRSLLGRLLLRLPPRRGLAAAALEETLGRLQRAGLEPIVVERPTGKVFGRGHLRMMRA
jgi:hypothetical protein